MSAPSWRCGWVGLGRCVAVWVHGQPLPHSIFSPPQTTTTRRYFPIPPSPQSKHLTSSHHPSRLCNNSPTHTLFLNYSPLLKKVVSLWLWLWWLLYQCPFFAFCRKDQPRKSIRDAAEKKRTEESFPSFPALVVSSAQAVNPLSSSACNSLKSISASAPALSDVAALSDTTPSSLISTPTSELEATLSSCSPSILLVAESYIDDDRGKDLFLIPQ